MKRANNKYLYLYVVQQYTGGGYGWEDVSASESWKEARADVKAYRENQPEYPARIIQRRELKEAATHEAH